MCFGARYGRELRAIMTNTDDNTQRPALLKRVGWLVLIWTASVLALSVVAMGMRFFMSAIGLEVR